MGKRKTNTASSGDAAPASPAKAAKVAPAVHKILVADAVDEAGVQAMRAAEGIEVTVKTGMKPDELCACIGEYDGIVVRSATTVNRETFEAASKGRGLKAVGRAGTGVDNIDLDAATKHGVIVMNAPGGNAMAAAEHTCALLFSLARHVPQANQSLREGRWDRKAYMGTELAGKSLGIAGLGRIGRMVAARATACQMNIFAYDPYLPKEMFDNMGVKKCETLDDLYRESDFLTLHMPLNDETRNMINAASFGKMRKGVRIINCARGGLVDEEALLKALDSGACGGAAVDVFEEEPPKNAVTRRVIEHAKVISTPHLGASTKEAQARCGVEMAEKMVEYFTSGAMLDSVNFPSIPRDAYKKLSPVVDLADRLGRFLAMAAGGSPLQLSVTTYGEFGGRHAEALAMAAAKGVLSVHMDAGVVRLVNALDIAKSRGLSVQRTHSSEATPYTGLLKIKIITDDDVISGAATMIGRGPRLVELEGETIESPLDTGLHMLVNRNNDVPGVVGKIGAVLGSHGLNISGLSLCKKTHLSGVDTPGKKPYAVSIVLVDSPNAAKAVPDLVALPDILRCRAVSL